MICTSLSLSLELGVESVRRMGVVRRGAVVEEDMGKVVVVVRW